MKALRKIAVIIVVLFLAFGPLLAVLPAFGQDIDPHPPISYTYLYTQGTFMQIDAPEGYVFTNVVWADFGEPYYDPNDGEYYSYPDCSTPFTTPMALFDIINGKSSVVIAADPAIYGNPCPQYQQKLGYTIEATFLDPYPTSSPTPSRTATEKTPTASASPETPVVPIIPTSTPTSTPVAPSKTPKPTQEPKSQESSFFHAIKWQPLSPEAREKAKKVVVATVIVSQVATAATMIRKRK